MVKRTDKSSHTKARTGMVAVREKQRKAGLPPNTQAVPQVLMASDEQVAVAGALLDMAMPDLEALDWNLTSEDANDLFGMAVQAYNGPILEANSSEAGNATVAKLQANSQSFHGSPGLQGRFERMLEVRRTRFAHLRQPILDCRVGVKADGTLSIGVVLVRKNETDLVLKGSGL